jgi:AAA family ATP:ADP antiporter
MLNWIEHVLGLRPGEFRRGILFFAYYFLIISSYVVGQVARDALFLERFDAAQLPYVDIGIALLVGVATATYIRAGRLVGLQGLLTGSLGLYTALGLFFWWGTRFLQSSWLYPAFYIWIGIFGVLAITQVWTLANFMLTTREAKRVFGLVGSGGILGGIFGGFLSTVMARSLGTENLLLIVALFPCVCALLVVLICQQQPDGVDEAGGKARAQSESRAWSLYESFKRVRSSAHLNSIAILICITSVVTTAVSWQFKAIAKASIAETDALAAFFGVFQGYAGILSLVAQLLLTSRLLQYLGVGPTLFILPLTLMLGTVGVLLSGGIVAVTFLKGSDKVLRYSVDTSALQLLYLPVPSRIKVQVKSFIDTVVWRLGDGLAGLTLLVFVTYLQFTPRQVGWIGLTGLCLWLIVADRARRQYLETLGDRVRENRIDVERASAPVLDASTASVLASKLTSSSTEDILYGLRLFDLGYHQAAHPAMRGLTRHSSAEVRARAVAALNAAGDTSVTEEVESLLRDEDLRVRTEALLYLTHHSDIDPIHRIQELGDFSDFTIRSAIAAFLSRPGTAQNLEGSRVMLDMMLDETGADGKPVRLEAARLIAQLPDPLEDHVTRLLADEDSEVASYAIMAAGNRPRLKFVPSLLSSLGDPDTRQEAALALSRFGSRIVGSLGDHLKDPEVPMTVRLEIPAVLAGIATPESQRALADCLLEGDTTLRYRILRALNKYQQSRPRDAIDSQWVETVLTAEILGHYRSYQALGLLGGELAGDDPSLEALKESMERERERIFRLLGLLFPEHDMHSAYVGLRSESARVYDDTLEFLDSTLRPELRSLLIPVLDGSVTLAERIRRANQLVGAGVDSSEEAVAMLMRSGDPWLKACAAYAIGALGLKSLESEMDAWRDDADPLLAETVRQAKMRLAEP